MLKKKIKRLIFTFPLCIFLLLATIWCSFNSLRPSNRAGKILPEVNVKASGNNEEFKQTLEKNSTPLGYSTEQLQEYTGNDSKEKDEFIVKIPDSETKPTLSGGMLDPLQDMWFEEIKKKNKRPNILFIIADDMRPDIGFYNKYFSEKGSAWLNQKMHTPFLDGLAAESLVFSRAYSQQPWCNPSRSSFLTSRRPDTTMVHNNTVYFRQNTPNIITIPQFFKSKGYFTASYGKVFHRLRVPGDGDDAYSWSQPTRNVNMGDLKLEPHDIVKPVPDKDLNKSQLTDQSIAQQVMDFLDDFSSDTNAAPFFLAMGLNKPHGPFVFPERFLQKYPLADVTMPSNPVSAEHMPSIAWFESFEYRHAQMCKPHAKEWTAEKPLPSNVIKRMRQGYYACISYVDELIGKVLGRLKVRGFGNNTVVVFIGDHGYHLGEQSIMGKNTVFEVAANAPMMIHIPGVTDKGMRTEQLAEFVDIFPTLVELAGFQKLSQCPESNSRTINLCTEGSSLVPLFRTKVPETFKWKDSVFYQYPHFTGKAHHFCMGYTIRTKQYRFTEWTPYVYREKDSPLVNRTTLCGVELYDHLKDPNETINIADNLQNRDTVSRLSAKLRQGWTKVAPQ